MVNASNSQVYKKDSGVQRVVPVVVVMGIIVELSLFTTYQDGGCVKYLHMQKVSVFY